MLLEKSLRALYVFLLNPFYFPGKCLCTDRMSDPVIGSISREGRDHHKYVQEPGVERAASGEGGRNEDKRITRQEGGDNKAGLHENNEEQQTVRPRAIAGDDLIQVYVNMQDKMHDL
jgi:hypothetical protein